METIKIPLKLASTSKQRMIAQDVTISLRDKRFVYAGTMTMEEEPDDPSMPWIEHKDWFVTTILRSKFDGVQYFRDYDEGVWTIRFHHSGSYIQISVDTKAEARAINDEVLNWIENA